MTPSRDISTARDPNLRAALTALHRAAKLARRVAIQTDTEIVIVRDDRIARIPAQVLRHEAEYGEESTR